MKGCFEQGHFLRICVFWNTAVIGQQNNMRWHFDWTSLSMTWSKNNKIEYCMQLIGTKQAFYSTTLPNHLNYLHGKKNIFHIALQNSHPSLSYSYYYCHNFHYFQHKKFSSSFLFLFCMNFCTDLAKILPKRLSLIMKSSLHPSLVLKAALRLSNCKTQNQNWIWFACAKS